MIPRVRPLTRRGGECPTARRSRRPAHRPAAATAKARQRDRCDDRAAHDDGDDDLSAYAKEVAEALPPLTDEQRDLLALIFRSSRPT